MDTRFVTSTRRQTAEEAQNLLDPSPRWIIVEENGQPCALLLAADLARYLERGVKAIDLMAIPAERLQLAPVQRHDSLQEALEVLDRSCADALYVSGASDRGGVHGVLTRQDVEASYRLPK
jgi:hypothetical protein